MGKVNAALYGFNRGIVSALALARTDQDRVALSAETMTNWMPRLFGAMALRPGTEYIGTTLSNNAGKLIPFVFSTNDVALLAFVAGNYHVWINDTVQTDNNRSFSISNGAFNTNLTNWTDDDESGAVSAWVTGGYMGLTGTGTNEARRYQAVTITGGEVSTLHNLHISIERGPVILRIGTTANDDDNFEETTLETGEHYINFTPTATTIYITFASALERQVLVNQCVEIASGAAIIHKSPWSAAELQDIRYDQSGDVIYAACDGEQPYKIQRRADDSFSAVKYLPENGPYLPENITPITMTAAATSGNTTLTASRAYFYSTHVGALFKLISTGQTVNSSIAAENTFTNVITVEGVDSQRVFTITLTGVWVGTVTLQRSLTSDTGPWEDVTTWTANTVESYDDTLDNQIAYYRIGIDTGDYTSGTVSATLDYPLGNVTGHCRVTGFTSATVVSVEVLSDFGNTDATADWAEGAWSTRQGWPTSVALAEGRLFWAGQDKIWGSVSDDFENFDSETVGDSAPINKTIGFGPVDTINWILSLQRLMIGAEGTEIETRSSSSDEPLTQANSRLVKVSTQGSNDVQAVSVDKSGIYIQRGGRRVMELAYRKDDQNRFNYESSNLTLLSEDVTSSKIVRMAVQRQPDTRIHCVRSDGKVAILIYDRGEEVYCWVLFETDGTVEDVAVLPGADGDEEDQVYYIVNRTINSSTVRYIEKWAMQSECEGGTTNKQADSFYVYSGTATVSITGLDHLEGESVIVWADGVDIGTYTVSSGVIAIDRPVTDAIVGLTYTAQFKSTKLAFAANQGTALSQKKRVTHLGLVLYKTHHDGLQYGPSFTDLSDLPSIKEGAVITDDTVHDNYDTEMFEFEGQWHTDSRLCLQAVAPKPCTIQAAIIGVETNEKF